MSDDLSQIRKILVIRLGALGDFVQSMGPMAAIRAAHPQAEIVLLTTPPFEGLARDCGLFNRVWTDGRPAWWHIGGRLDLAKRLRAAGFERVYDLQTSKRSGRVFHLLRKSRRGAPEWSGHVAGASHPDPNPDRDQLHSIDRQRGQLAGAGIETVPLTDLSWADTDPRAFGLSGRYALLVPGGSAHRPAKRWPAEKYGALARILVADGVLPAIIGGPAEADAAEGIRRLCPRAVDLTGKTSFQEIAALARGALGGVGNDTGPMHLIAMAGAPSLVLFSRESDPALCAPRPGASGGFVKILRRHPLSALSVEEVRADLPFVTKA